MLFVSDSYLTTPFTRKNPGYLSGKLEIAGVERGGVCASVTWVVS